MDELLNLKGVELKNYIIKYGLLTAVARNENPAALLWFLRKKVRAIDSYTVAEVETIMGLNEDGRHSKYAPLLAYVTHKQ